MQNVLEKYDEVIDGNKTESFRIGRVFAEFIHILILYSFLSFLSPLSTNLFLIFMPNLGPSGTTLDTDSHIQKLKEEMINQQVFFYIFSLFLFIFFFN